MAESQNAVLWGEEGTPWRLPARFHSSTSISVWASHRLFLPLQASHHSSLPPSVLLSCTSPDLCVFGCFRSPAGCVGSGRRKERKRRQEPWLQSSVTQPGCISASGENTENVYENKLLSCNQRAQMLTFPALTSISESFSRVARSGRAVTGG